MSRAAALRTVCLTVLLACAGCDGEPEPTRDGGGTVDTGDVGGEVDADAAVDLTALPEESDCDPVVRSRCALPWPSNKYLSPDENRETGYTLSFAGALPSSTGDGTDPSTWERLDGYGFGTPIMLAYENPDPSQFPNETAIEESVAEDATILLYEVDGDSLSRVPYWAEVDARADEYSGPPMVIVRPAVILEPDTRYVVAFRNLKHADGSPVEPSAAFQRLRAGAVPEDHALSERAERFEEMFELLEGEGVDREALTVAWDFRTASHRAMHGTMVEARDRGFDAVGAQGPELTIDDVTRYVPSEDGSGRPQNGEMGLEVEGTFRVPRFTEETTIRGSNGWTLSRNPEGALEQNGWKESKFWMLVPQSAINADPEGTSTPGNGNDHGLIQYGHGLLGTGGQTLGGFNQTIANDHDFIVFGSTLFGMASDDQQTALEAVADITKFEFMADRLHQGMMEYLLLMRAMKQRLSETQLASDYGLKIAPDDAYYSGISQGGIFGGTYLALSQDVERGHLGVPGNNYSTLLGRSVDFEPFFAAMSTSYQNRLDQLLAIAAIQLLWEQTEPVSYLRHIRKDPIRETSAHDVLLAPAKGDYQVAPITNEVAARTDNGIELMDNYPKDVALVEPQSFPHEGSGVVLYDFGNPWAEPGNTPPEKTDRGDPHGKPRQKDWHNEQMVHFFRTGEIINTCDDDGDPVCNPQ